MVLKVINKYHLHKIMVQEIIRLHLNTEVTSFNYNLNSFSISSSSSDCWGNDIEEFCETIFGVEICTGTPDIIIKIYDGDGFWFMRQTI